MGVTAHPGRCGVKYTPWPKRDPIKNYFQRLRVQEQRQLVVVLIAGFFHVAVDLLFC